MKCKPLQCCAAYDCRHRRAGWIIQKVVESAIANAEHNDGADIDELRITRIFVDQGPVFKRFRPRAKGRASKILKPTCHISVTVGDLSKE